MFKRVLIANRGEIAIRIARAASALGVESVAVHAPADALSLHAKLATSAREIGAREIGNGAALAADPVRAYLDVEAIITAAKESGSDCGKVGDRCTKCHWPKACSSWSRKPPAANRRSV